MADPSWPAEVASAVAAIDRPGDFCVSGTAPAVLPGLDVAGLGPIGLPLSADQAERLKRQCERAAYGKGTETVVDTAVRRVWRLTPDRFTLANPAWPAAVNEMVAAVQQALGLDRQPLRPHLHDLLLYEPGGFFLPHRDGEKLDRMVATLVVVLPSHFTGGQLLVRHEGRERAIDLGGEPARFQTQYAAFYADCEHEVRPVTAGHRLCLVYNLTLAKATKAVGAPRRDHHVRRLADLLGRWPATTDAADGDGPAKLAVTLEHQYTKDGLAWDALKGVDRARADVLAAAATAAGCRAYLALLTRWEVGSSNGPDGDWDRGGYDDDDDDDEEEDNDGDGSPDGKYEMDELLDESLTADGWRAADGSAAPFGELPVDEAEVWPRGSLAKVEPEEQYEGYTGNAGMTLERWYRRAAIVVWPDAHHFDVLCDAGAKQAVPALLQLADAATAATGDEAAALRDQCRRFATAVLDAWPSAVDRWDRGDKAASPDPLPALAVADDVGLIRTYLRDTLQKDTALHPGPALPAVLSRHGWPTFGPDLAALFERSDAASLGRDVRLLHQLCRAAARLPDRSRRPAARSVCRALARPVVRAAIAVNQTADRRFPTDPARAADRLGRLAHGLLLARGRTSLGRLVDHLIATPDGYPMQAVQMPAVLRLGRSVGRRPSPPMARWVADVRRRLTSLTAAQPQPPTDQRRAATVSCKCGDCAELNRFLADPAERQHGFKMAEARRKHLESQIRAFRCDVNCVTDRRPRPQILVCTKTDATYRRLLAEYHQDQVYLAELDRTYPTG